MAPAAPRKAMPRWQVMSVFAFVAISLIVAVLLIYNTIGAERREREQMAKTNEILLELRNVSRAAVNGETGQRGYYITLDRRYLGPYVSGRELYGPALERLRARIGPDITTRQDQLLREIEQLSAERFADLDESVALIERGELIEAQQRILSDEGQLVMARLRNAIAEMEVIENAILAQAIGEVAEAEGRILPLLGLLLLMLLVALALGYFQVARTAAAEAAASQAEELSRAHDRADLLARELNHRVKNLFAVILAIVRMSGRGVPEAEPVVERIDQRIRALLTAHEVTQGAPGKRLADLHELVETTLAPYKGGGGEAVLEGPTISLSATQVTPLGLVLHELTTNAVKYGAWSRAGTIAIDWRLQDGQLALDWAERGGPAPVQSEEASSKEGFGTMLMQSAARQLSGKIIRNFTDAGVHVRIEFPHEAG